MATTAAPVTRSSLIELDLPGEALSTVEIKKDLAPAAVEPFYADATADDGAGGWNRGVSRAVADLAAREAALARAHGIDVDDADLLFEAGTQLADVGLEASQKFAEEYARAPSLAEAAAAHAAAIKAEDRRDREISLPSWRLDGQGRFCSQVPNVDAGATARLSNTAWLSLTQQQPNGSAVPSGNVNAWIADASAKPRKARVRGPADACEIYGLVSTRYTSYDSDRVLADFARLMPADVKCELVYDQATTRMRARAYVQAPVDVPALVGVGRVHQIGVSISTRDDGMGSIEASAFLFRVRCKNHTLAESRGRATSRARHMGKLPTLEAKVAAVVDGLPEMISEFRDLWARAAADYYLDSESGAQLSAPEALLRLVAAGHLPRCGESVEDATDRYVRAWRAEDSPHSAAGIVMAAQRAAHEGEWRTKWADDEIETSASALLYQSVFALDAVEA